MTTTDASRLRLADVDGTLVTPDKVLTDRAVGAVRRRGEAGILFAITSGRPPRGMSMLIEPLNIATPIAAFNGGLLVNPDMSLVEQRVLPEAPSTGSSCPEADPLCAPIRANTCPHPARSAPAGQHARVAGAACQPGTQAGQDRPSQSVDAFTSTVSLTVRSPRPRKVRVKK